MGLGEKKSLKIQKRGENDMNPAAMFKIMQAKNTFTKNHPKFEAFLKNVMANKIVEGTVIEVSIQRPGEEAVTTNIRVQQSDLDLVQSLKELGQS